MGLLQNGYRHNLTGRIIGATNLDGANPYVLVGQGHLTPRNRNMFAGQGITDSKAAVPNGNLPHSAWIMPRKSGGMSSRSAAITITAYADGLMGMPGAGIATITFTVPDVEGQLIVSGSGTAAIVFSTNTPLLTASINGEGSASFTISAEGSIGALADMVGESSIVFGATGSILPEDDTSPLRSGTALFSFSGSLTSYAVGHMEGTTDVEVELTADSIVSALWGATASAYNESGTMGNKLNTASSGGVDMTALVEAMWADPNATTLLEDSEYMIKILVNKREIKKIDSVWTLVVYDNDNTSIILSKPLKDYTGNDITDLVPGVLAQELQSDV